MPVELPPGFDTSELSVPAGVAEFSAFAVSNGLRFERDVVAPEYSGALFGYLDDALLRARFLGMIEDRFFEVGTVSGTVGGSQSRELPGGVRVTASVQTTRRSTHGYVVLQLDRVMPHIVLDATRNDRVFGSSIPMPIARDQRLPLEGDFDRYFTLYCPSGYERDALYVMTPDLMELLVDDAGDLDVEIVDDRMFLYANGAFDFGDSRFWDRLGAIRAVIGAKALSQTGRYADDRVGDRAANIVSRDGTRLRQSGLGTSTSMTPRRVLVLVGAGFVVVIGVIVTAFVVIGQAVLQ